MSRRVGGDENSLACLSHMAIFVCSGLRHLIEDFPHALRSGILRYRYPETELTPGIGVADEPARLAGVARDVPEGLIDAENERLLEPHAVEVGGARRLHSSGQRHVSGSL